LISKKLKKKDSIEKKPKAGFLKGTFFMSPDFDRRRMLITNF